MVATSVPNDDIRWETTRTWNLGVDLGFWNNRVTTSFDWFGQEASDILMQLAMPGIFLGNLGAPYQNVGTVRNRGLEWSVNYLDSYGDWTWNVGFSIISCEERNSRHGRSGRAYLRQYHQPHRRSYRIILCAQGYRHLPHTGYVNNRLHPRRTGCHSYGSVPSPAISCMRDVDGSGDVNDTDRKIIGNPFPKYSYAFNLGAT